ncbi:MAG: choice-of-anchor tandem repeat GloVer-containing protein [Bryobacteraceae bacterium]
MQATDGHLYGTTECGGTYGDRTVFKITAGGTLTTRHPFRPHATAQPD